MIERLNVLNSNRVLPSTKNVISNFSSIIWNTEYYGTGDFKMTLPVTEESINIFTDNDNQYISRSDDENIGVIENIKIKRSCAEPSIEVSGRFAKSLLDRRIVGNAGTIVNTGKEYYEAIVLPIRGGSRLDQNIRYLVANAIVLEEAVESPRRIPFIKLGPDPRITDITLTSKVQATGSELLDFTDSLLAEYGLGAKLVLDPTTKNFLYVIYRGLDRTLGNSDNNKEIVFSPKLSNFINTEKVSNITGYKNVAVVGGQGEGSDRFYSVIKWENPDTVRSVDRREVFIDARDISKTYIDSGGTEHEYSDSDYKEMLVERGNNRLKEMIVEESFSGEVSPSMTSYIYKQDYNVGDIVSVTDEDGRYFIARVLSVTESQDSSNGYSAFPKLG